MDYPIEKIMSISKVAAQSKFFGTLTVDQIAMIGLVAQDLNLPISTALMGGINIIQGKPSLSARVMNLLIRRAGHSMTVVQEVASCTIKGKRKDNGDEAIVSFTLKDAQDAGLASKDNWKKHQADMLFSRALSRIARQLFPDCIEGAYVEGELDTEKPKKEEKETIDVEVTPLPEEPLINSEQIEVIEAKCKFLPSSKVDKLLDKKGYQSWSEMPSKFFNDCVKFLDDLIDKEVSKRDQPLPEKAPWEDQ